MDASRTEARGARTRALGFHPLYRQVRDLLVKPIVDGVWKPGEVLPNEFDIAADLGVSQGTVRKALDELEAEKFVLRRQGKGTFVAYHDEARILFQFFKLVPDSGVSEFLDSRFLSVAAVAADARAASALVLRGRAGGADRAGSLARGPYLHFRAHPAAARAVSRHREARSTEQSVRNSIARISASPSCALRKS